MFLKTYCIKPKQKILAKMLLIAKITSILIFTNCLQVSAKVNSGSLPVFEVHGKVTDRNNKPLPNVSIFVAGTKIGTTTDINGRFSLDIPNNKNIVLEISSVGFQTRKINLGNWNEIDIILEEDIAGLDEVVIGYGSIRKKDFTGSVSQVTGADLNAFSAANPLLTLSGRAAGVQIKQVGGHPGEQVFIRIRGSNSIRGNNDPLYVIDGIPTDDPYILNNADIESMDILKDASATAIYGSRGANGVVIITTKGGRAGRSKVKLESRVSVQKLRKKLDLMGVDEYTTFYNKVVDNSPNSTLPYHYTPEMIKSYGEGTDWQDLIFQNALMHDHSLTFTGGDAKTQFAASGSVFDQKGIIENSSYERYSARFKLHHKVNDRLQLDVSSIITRSNQTLQHSQGARLGGSLIAAIITAPPFIKPYDSTGRPTVFSDVYPISSPSMGNPLLYTKLTTGGQVRNDITTSASLEYNIIKNLRLKIHGGFVTKDSRNDAFTSSQFSSQSLARVSVNNFTSVLSENTLDYKIKFGKEKHTLNVLIGQTYQNFINKGLSGSGTELLSDLVGTHSLASARIPGIPGSNYKKSTILSYIGRINYNYNDILLLTSTFRADGSSKYSPGEKWGYFPSFAIAWNLKEKTLDNVNFISEFKLRSSWGMTGSQAINEYSTLDLLSAGSTIFGGDIRTLTLAPSNTLPFHLRWETTTQLDFGIDASFFDGKFKFTADYYKKDTRDLLSIVTLPTSSGYSSSIQNIGSIRNTGVEFSLNADIVKSNKFSWTASGNISFNRNKVVKLYKGEDIITGHYNFTGGQSSDDLVLLREGEPLGMFYGYVEDGYEEDKNGVLSIIKYADRNNDSVINILDKVKIGDPNPDFTYGFNTFLTYGAFSLSAYFQGNYGNDIANLSVGNLYETGYQVNTLKKMAYNLATKENPHAKYPQPVQNRGNTYFSRRFIEDGSYLRLQHLELGYTLQKDSRSAYFFVSGDNLFTLTKYSWWDPEVNAHGVDIVQGVDHNTYPKAKSYTVGIRLSF
jgi:TonB-linked SusC/RagA family outer membrane protein